MHHVTVLMQGKEIDMSQKPDGIDYVIDAVRSSCKPVLILCKEYVGCTFVLWPFNTVVKGASVLAGSI